jgi:hypothetical protein
MHAAPTQPRGCVRARPLTGDVLPLLLFAQNANLKPATPRRVQPLGGGQAGGRLSGALGLPPPPPPLPGEVFLWGHHADSSFGVASAAGKRLRFDAGKTPPDRSALLPSALSRSEGLDVATISLGTLHGALLSRDGQVFTWGRSDHGRLGHGSQHHVAAPARVDALSDTHVVQVACSNLQTMAVTEDGQLLVWGCGAGPAGSAACCLIPHRRACCPFDTARARARAQGDVAVRRFRAQRIQNAVGAARGARAAAGCCGAASCVWPVAQRACCCRRSRVHLG